METWDTIIQRRSCHKFKTQPVEWDKIGKMLEAGRHAPSAGNLQNWRFIVITNKQKRDALAHVCAQQYWIGTAPIIIVVCSEPEKLERQFGKRGKEMYAPQNAAAATQNMILMAQDQGLASCWIGNFDESSVKPILGIPATIKVETIIPIGYADEKPYEPVKYTLEDVVFLNGWQGKVKHPNLSLENWGAIASDCAASGSEACKTLTQKSVEKLKEFHSKVKAKIAEKKNK